MAGNNRVRRCAAWLAGAACEVAVRRRDVGVWGDSTVFRSTVLVVEVCCESRGVGEVSRGKRRWGWVVARSEKIDGIEGAW